MVSNGCMMLLKTKMQKLNKLLPYMGIAFFISKISLLYFSWTLMYEKVIEGSTLDAWITGNVAWISAGILNLMGQQALASHNTVSIDGLPLVIIGGPCNSIEFFGLFACFVLAYPSRIVHKLWFIPVGILFIHLLNIIRVVLLALNLWYSRESFEFNHKYTFILFIYGLTFLLWTAWVKRFTAPVATPTSS